MAETRPSRLLPIFLIVVVLVVAGVGVGLLYELNHPKATTPPYAVALGDNVTVNYIGTFGSGAQIGKVFDTSIYSVAVNNASYPKSLGFTYRGSPSQYVPLGVHVGPTTPSGGYSLDGITFGSVVTGFWQGLVGLPLNKASTITVPPNLGYGPLNASCLVTQPLSYTLRVLNPLSTAAFAALYPNVTGAPGTEFTDPTYGWTDLVLSVNSTAVTVEFLPTVGWSVPGTAWPVVVTNLTASTITVANQLTAAQAGLVQGHVANKVCDSSSYIVSSVNPATGTYVENFNSEVTGETLIFTVTVVAHY